MQFGRFCLCVCKTIDYIVPSIHPLSLMEHFQILLIIVHKMPQNAGVLRVCVRPKITAANLISLQLERDTILRIRG